MISIYVLQIMEEHSSIAESWLTNARRLSLETAPDSHVTFASKLLGNLTLRQLRRTSYMSVSSLVDKARIT